MSLSGLSVQELQEVCRKACEQLHAQIGTGAVHRCSVCLKLACDHPDNAVAGCTAAEISEEAFRHSLMDQANSARVALDHLRQIPDMTASLAAIMVKATKLEADRDGLVASLDAKRDECDALVVANNELRSDKQDVGQQLAALKDQLADTDNQLADSDNRLAVVNDQLAAANVRENDLLVEIAGLRASNVRERHGIIGCWTDYLSGSLSDKLLVEKLHDDYDVSISSSLFAPPPILTPSLTPSGVAVSTATPSSGGGASSGAPPPPSGLAASSAGVMAPFGGVAAPTPGSVAPSSGFPASTAVTAVYSTALATPGLSGGATSFGVTPSSGASAPFSVPATSGAAAQLGGAPDGDKVGKSAKTIKTEFKQRDAAHHHLQKEAAILNAIDLLYPSANVATKISIIG